MQTDRFNGVRAAAATSLGAVGGAEAAGALQDALGQPDDQVHTAAAALGKLKGDARVFATESRLLRTDRSHAVQAAAAGAIGASGNPTAFDVLSQHIDPTWDWHLLDALLNAIAATHDPRAVGSLFAWARPGIPEHERDTALAALAGAHFSLSGYQKRELASIAHAAQHDPVQITREAGLEVVR